MKHIKGITCIINSLFRTAIFKYAITTGETDRVSHFHVHVENWMISWELSLSDRRSLYRLVSEVMVGEDKSPLALRYLVKFFGTFSEERFPVDVESLAKVSVINAIKSPVSSFSDRNALLEVRLMRSDIKTYYP